ncbi:hypothetical protein NL676_039231 [Syzygium grande]|nr:hypothetical protein NL676_039231 [Syzygium grande]
MAMKMHQRRKARNGGRQEVSATTVASETSRKLLRLLLVPTPRAERVEVVTAGLKARCRELRHGRNSENTVPKVGRREARRRRSPLRRTSDRRKAHPR